MGLIELTKVVLRLLDGSLQLPAEVGALQSCDIIGQKVPGRNPREKVGCTDALGEICLGFVSFHSIIYRSISVSILSTRCRRSHDVKIWKFGSPGVQSCSGSLHQDILKLMSWPRVPNFPCPSIGIVQQVLRLRGL